jgi:Tfp pilus assembly PilM family ATPase
VSRFVRLPPVKDKAALLLVQQEVDQKIPIESDELAIVRWIAELDEDELHGRPAVITAAKTNAIQERLDLLSQAGLNVSGLQADPVALTNFAAYEFAELWADHQEVAEIDDSDNDADAEDQPQEDDSTELGPSSPTVAMVDCGASTTSLILVSGEAHWSWTIETGGEDLTSRLARSTKTKHSEAEQLKRNPAALTTPARQYKFIEDRQEELRSRLQTSLAEAIKQNPGFDVVQTWCFGGACLSHGWFRRMMLG